MTVRPNNCSQLTRRRTAPGAEAPRSHSTGAAPRPLHLAPAEHVLQSRQRPRRSGRCAAEKHLAAEAIGE